MCSTHQCGVFLNEIVHHLTESIPAHVGLLLVVHEQASRHQSRATICPRQRLGIMPEPTRTSEVSDCLTLMCTSHQVLTHLGRIFNCGCVVSDIISSALVYLVSSPDRDVHLSQHGRGCNAHDVAPLFLTVVSFWLVYPPASPCGTGRRVLLLSAQSYLLVLRHTRGRSYS